ncbi:MAG TPA: phosphotransferase, partial [Tepidiformaceae bacterium]|nr:phosphotransferase [Tepidiformaceae bacterium]
MPELPDSVRLADIDAVLAAYGLARTGMPVRTEGGTLNANYRTPTAGGAVFVRLHREGFTAGRVRAEHDILDFVRARGIPVPRPLSTTSGHTTVDTTAGTWSVYPWLEGEHPVRGELGTRRAAALGEMHGRIHGVLATHPASPGASFTMAWDRDHSLETLARIDAAAAARGADPWIREGIALQASLLRAEPLRYPRDFAGLPCQLAHGDYHDQQVLFDPAGSVAAVTDWELCGPFARIWDVVRSLAFSLLFSTPGLEEYMAGYGGPSRSRPRSATSAWSSGGRAAWGARGSGPPSSSKATNASHASSRRPSPRCVSWRTLPGAGRPNAAWCERRPAERPSPGAVSRPPADFAVPWRGG